MQEKRRRYNPELEEKNADQEKNNTEQIKEKKEHPILKKTILTILFIIIALLIYISSIEHMFINIKEYKIESTNIPNSFDGLKIVHFSDIHYGTTVDNKKLNQIVNKINKLNPDIIFFTGDLINKNIIINEETQKEIITALNNLNPKLYKYAIYGDEDYENKTYRTIMENANFKLLDNESTLLYYKDNTPVEITGFSPTNSSPNYTILTNLIENNDPNNLYKIVLVHEPDSLDKFINYNPNLVLSGHSLGGLIRIPLLKPLFLKENSQKYYNDYYKINNSDFYISNGLGTSNLNARLNNLPSINFYRLYKKNETN